LCQDGAKEPSIIDQEKTQTAETVGDASVAKTQESIVSLEVTLLAPEKLTTVSQSIEEYPTSTSTQEVIKLTQETAIEPIKTETTTTAPKTLKTEATSTTQISSSLKTAPSGAGSSISTPWSSSTLAKNQAGISSSSSTNSSPLITTTLASTINTKDPSAYVR
jgi:hypothetical protein